MDSFRGTSTRTRIETKIESAPTPLSWPLSEEHPPEQGLKHATPVETITKVMLSEEHPPEQGLKHYISDTVKSEIMLSEEHPPEQGLKRGNTSIGIYDNLSFRGTSTRTRIETRKYVYRNIR